MQYLSKILFVMVVSVALMACSNSSSGSGGGRSGNNSDIPTAFNNNSLTGFNDDARNGTSDNALKIENAVQITKNSDDSTITTEKITDSIIDFDYDIRGNFATDGLRIYVADKKYSASDADATGSYINDYSPDSDDDDRVDRFGLYRNNVNFGFTPDYLALVSWWVTDNDNKNIAFAITGFRTRAGNIPSSDNATFTGKGRGQYYSVASDYFTYFDVSADVDFEARNVSLTGKNTCISKSVNDCVQASYQQSDLNFTGDLSYVADINAISGTVTTKGGDNIAKLTGTADARFYGGNTQELGGTFIMQNDDAGYVGWFGATQPYTISSETLTTDEMIDEDMPTEFNENNLTGFNDEDRDGTGRDDKNNDDPDDDAIINALKIENAVQITRNTDNKTIITEEITGAVVEFDYERNGEFSNDGLRIYFADKKYRVTSANVTDEYINDASPISSDGDSPNRLGLYRNGANFGFTPNYLALVSWWETDADEDNIVFAITGFETGADDIPTTDSSKFTGRGRGQYYSIAADYFTYFDVSADVDFADRDVVLTATNTCISDSVTDCAQAKYQQSILNFTGTLSYEEATNAISGNVETVGGDDSSKLSGMAGARFYGTGDDVATELGGTFTMQNNEAGYVGWFGLTQPYIISSETLTTDAMIGDDDDAETVPTDFNSNSLTGFNDENRIDTSDNALKVENALQITRNIDNKTIIIEKITGSVIEFNYDIKGGFIDDALNFYFSDKKYSVTNADATYGYINDVSPVTSDGDIPDRFGFYSDSVNFGFTPNYLALVSWWVNEDDYETHSVAIAGFETDGDDIPASNTATFIGKGGGQYYSPTIGRAYYFDVSAVIDFGTLNVVVTGANSCISNDVIDCAQAHYQQSELDWTGELSYIAGENAISGNIETAGGESYAKLSGTAQAKFYGTGDNVATELGGTFIMQNDDAVYVGYFGATKPYAIQPSTTIATNIASMPTDFNKNNLTGFNDENRHGTSNNALKIENAVQITKNTANKTVISNKITGSVIEFGYKKSGGFNNDGLSLYFTDKKYRTTNPAINPYDIHDKSPHSGSSDRPQDFGLYRNNNSLGFTADYLALVFWGLEQSDYAAKGFAIAGFETDGSDIPTTSNATFTGKGQGQYYSTNDDNYFYFDVSADIDFADRNVVITATNTCSSDNDATCAQANYQRADLNFTGTLNYAKNINAISGNIATKGDADNAPLIGAAQARFYGTGTDSATELGGTFMMQNDDAGYSGYFGAKQP